MLKSRLEKHYEKVVLEDFLLLYNYKSIYSLPRMQHLIFHSSSKSFSLNENALLESFSALFLGTGCRPVISKAHKSIAQFSVRKNDILGVRVTLRKKVLFNLLEKLSIFVIPNQLKSKRFEIEKKKRLKVKHNEVVLEGLLQSIETRSFSVSGKDTKTFPETSILLLFFSSFTGFGLTGFFSNDKRIDTRSKNTSKKTSFSSCVPLSSTFWSTSLTQDRSIFPQRKKSCIKRPNLDKTQQSCVKIQDDLQALHRVPLDDKVTFLKNYRFSENFFLGKNKKNNASSDLTEKQQFKDLNFSASEIQVKEQWLSAFQFPYNIKL